MKLNKYDTLNILKEFPRIKLSYVKTIHKKVSSANLYYLIPKGKKYFVWFRYFKNKEACLFLEINSKEKTIKEIIVKVCCFNSNLCYKKGTIFYGTLIKKNNVEFFSIEDIYYYKNNNLSDTLQEVKLNNIIDAFQNNIKQEIISKHNVVIGMPIISTNREIIERKSLNTPYPIYCIQHRYNNNSTYFNEKIQNYSKVFLIKPDIICDLYNLYLKDSIGNDCFYKTALIPDYNKSCFMNTIFRNIKENDNLDLLEESDDEDEFENIKETKYIKKQQARMICDYNIFHKMWVPREITTLNIDNKKEILNIEKNIN